MANNKKPRKAYRPRGVNPSAHMVALMGVAWLDQPEIDYRTKVLTEAVEAATQGRAEQGHWRNVFDAANILDALLQLRIASGAGIGALQDLMDTVMERKSKTGSSALKHEERQILQDLLDTYTEVLPNLTNHDLMRAEELVAETVRRALAGASIPGVSVVRAEALGVAV
jgi:DNA-binding GntR family transcriptional regulator